MLDNKWIYFHFLSEEIKQSIASRYWVIRVGSLPKNSCEDIYGCYYQATHYTTRILGAILELGNSIGNFVMVEEEIQRQAMVD